MAKLDPLSKVGIVLVIVVALGGGLGVWWWSKQPLQPTGGDPTPSASAVSPTPTPTCDAGTDPCTPEVAAEQAETRKLVQRAKRANQVSFDERTRLGREGGADEPSELLRQHTAERYLELVTELLREQKRVGSVGGGSSTMTAVPHPGESRSGSDPDLTLEVCEDNSHATFTLDGRTYQGQSSKGLVFAKVIDNQVKLVDASMKAVESCI